MDQEKGDKETNKFIEVWNGKIDYTVLGQRI